MSASETFLTLLSDYINDRPVCSVKENIDYEMVYSLASIHSLLSILGAIDNKYSLGFPEEIHLELEAQLATAVIQSTVWDNLYRELSSAFDKEGICNIIVKGPVVKHYYPDPELRTMGDIDFVIHSTDIDKANQIMLKHGFEPEEGCIDEYKFMRSGACVELHEDLTSKDFGNGIDYKKEMQFIFDSVKDKSVNSRELTNESHLIYLILHIAQHLISEGCGIRQILDVAVFVKNSGVDMEKVWELLKKLDLETLAHNIFYLCGEWFDVKCDDYVPDSELYEMLRKYVLEGGTFGFNASRENNLMFREEFQKGSKIKVFLSRVFPGKEEARSKVIWFRDKPDFLLPVAWVIRWFDMCRLNPQRVKNYFKSFIKHNGSESENEYIMLKQLGFYKDKL